MNVLARTLLAQGTPSYAPDIRGHGASGRRGDIDHIGELEDDLSDLVAVIHHDYPGSPIVLTGHSSGGGFVLRVAAEPEGRQFSKFVLLAPYLGAGRPTTRPASGGWVAAYIPRIVGLTVLNRFGVTALNGLPTLAFAASPRQPQRTWSYRLMTNFGPPGLTTQLRRPDPRRGQEGAPPPSSVIAGDQGREHGRPGLRPRLRRPSTPGQPQVTIPPGVGHMDLHQRPRRPSRWWWPRSWARPADGI